MSLVKLKFQDFRKKPRDSAKLVHNFAIFILFFTIVEITSAEPRVELLNRMELLKQSVNEEQQAANEAEAQAKSMERDLRTLKTEIDKLKSEERTLLANLNKLEQSQSKAERDRANLISEQARIKKRVVERIRAVYLVPKASVLATLVHNDRVISLGLVNRYLEAVYAHDLQLAAKLRTVGANIQTQSLTINSLVAKQRAGASELRIRRDALSEKLAGQQKISAAALNEQARREKIIAELRAKLLRFESALAGLTGGTYEVGDAAPEGSVGQGAQTQNSHANERVDESFDGPGLRLKPILELPVSGKVVTRFGGTRKDGHASRGLEISAPGLSRVRVIAGGRVVFVGDLPGLNTVVIVDHGNRSFSLYGRLGSATCLPGSVLRGAETVGEASGDKPLYFEIRLAGAAVDPKGYINGLG